ncbi:MAG: HMA2 domain-containing protein [Candidatus Deferrimicrobium sp.]
MTIPSASIRHRMDGRLRVKIPARKGDPAYFSALAEVFSEFPGIRKVEVNPETGSALFLHSAEPDAIVAHAQGKGLFRIVESTNRPVHVSVGIKAKYMEFDEKVKRYTGGAWDVPAVAFASLAGAGVYQIARGNFGAPVWYTAFWYALNIFLKARGGDNGISE